MTLPFDPKGQGFLYCLLDSAKPAALGRATPEVLLLESRVELHGFQGKPRVSGVKLTGPLIPIGRESATHCARQSNADGPCYWAFL